MRNQLLVAALLAAGPAMAADEPIPLTNDGLVCQQNYDANVVTVIHMEKGREVTIEVSPTEIIQKIAASDTANLQTSKLDGHNIMWLKPTFALHPQSVSVITSRPDLTLPPRVYLFEVDAREAVVETLEASQADQPPRPPCHLIRFRYPGDAAAVVQAKVTETCKAASERWLAIHDAQLLRQTQLANRHWKYVARGNKDLAPDSIFDDGYSTFLEYDGNRAVPAIWEHLGHNKDRLLLGWNAEENPCPDSTAQAATCIKIHDVLRSVTLRDREDYSGDMPSLTIYNRGYGARGNPPGTGTSSPAVEREVPEPAVAKRK